MKEAKKLNDDDVKLPSKNASKEKKEIIVPDYFLKALKKNKKALITFEKFSPSHKRDYIEWIIDAKTEETRTK
ncbi:MAG: YdeI/OmpD-associated family protein [Melioribacter sp.]|nr:YdeI/OmpD-associated family protein [Melioribacter sp.]